MTRMAECLCNFQAAKGTLLRVRWELDEDRASAYCTGEPISPTAGATNDRHSLTSPDFGLTVNCCRSQCTVQADVRAVR